MQLALGVGAFVAVGALGIYLLYLLIGEPIFYIVLAGLIAGSLVWIGDVVTEKWTERKNQRTGGA
jgi:hypothetical protein